MMLSPERNLEKLTNSSPGVIIMLYSARHIFTRRIRINHIKRFIALKKFSSGVLLLLTSLLLFAAIVGAAAPDPLSGLEPAVIESGVYTIQNFSDSLYLNALDISYASAGYAYVDKYSGEEGENILLLRQEDGSYLLYPQSETGKYALYAEETEPGARIAKQEDIVSGAYFNIYRDNDAYVLSPKDSRLALCVSGKNILYRKQLVTSEKYTGADAQKWTINPVPISAFEIKTVAEKIRVNSVSAVYAVVTPAYMKNFVKWRSSDESVVMLDDDGTFCALSVGSATVTATAGDMQASIVVEVVDEPAYTWYSQHLATEGGWHGGELSEVYFYAGAYKRFIIDRFNRGLDWMDEGCAVTSVAMVLHNLGARYTDGYDFRFEADGNLEADPYTVALANTGNRGLFTSSGTLYFNPILMNLRVITSHFTLYGKKLTYEQSYGVTKQKIKEALDAHPEGVIIQMQNTYNGSHYIVVTKCVNPTASNSNDYKFFIYDSAALKREQGDNVLFEDSISYQTMRYTYSHMISMITFGLAEEETK